MSQYVPADAPGDFVSALADLAVGCETEIDQLKIKDWVGNLDVINRIKNAVEDQLYTFDGQHNLGLTNGDLDNLIDGIVETAKRRDHLNS